MTKHKWQFAPRFRHHVFGWRSDTPIQRIKEALAEVKQVAKNEPLLAAEGAVLFLEKLSPALENVDSSSGAIGSAVNRAIETLVPVIAKAPAESAVRQVWLERLWQALLDDGMSYIEWLGDFWGELCADPDLAAHWADELCPCLEEHWSRPNSGHGYYQGTTPCLASLFAAGRHEELLALLAKAKLKWWHDRRWGVKALAAQGRKAEAIRYAEDSRGLNAPGWQIAAACEDILLSSGLADEAYRRYAIEANQASTNLATFKAIVRKYPNVPPETILRDLVAHDPGREGKWFAAAKDAGLFDFAIELAHRSATDPRTLARAARDYREKQPAFAVAAGLAALEGIARGQGYDITALDVWNAFDPLMKAAVQAGIAESRIEDQVRALAVDKLPFGRFLLDVLKSRLSS